MTAARCPRCGHPSHVGRCPERLGTTTWRCPCVQNTIAEHSSEATAGGISAELMDLLAAAKELAAIHRYAEPERGQCQCAICRAWRALPQNIKEIFT